MAAASVHPAAGLFRRRVFLSHPDSCLPSESLPEGDTTRWARLISEHTDNGAGMPRITEDTAQKTPAGAYGSGADQDQSVVTTWISGSAHAIPCAAKDW